MAATSSRRWRVRSRSRAGHANGPSSWCGKAHHSLQRKPERSAAVAKTARDYFVNNVGRMQYGTFRAKGYFIDSGVSEARCRKPQRAALQAIRRVLDQGGGRCRPSPCAASTPATGSTGSGATVSTTAPPRTIACTPSAEEFGHAPCFELCKILLHGTPHA